MIRTFCVGTFCKSTVFALLYVINPAETKCDKMLLYCNFLGISIIMALILQTFYNLLTAVREQTKEK